MSTDIDAKDYQGEVVIHYLPIELCEDTQSEARMEMSLAKIAKRVHMCHHESQTSCIPKSGKSFKEWGPHGKGKLDKLTQAHKL